MDAREPLQHEAIHIAAHLEGIGITQRRFARMLGVTDGMVSSYLNGRKSPGSKLIERIAEVLSSEIEYDSKMGWMIEVAKKQIK